jgi:hypothetical protein
VQVRVARDLVSRSLTRAILELDRELASLTAQTAPALLELPGCGGLTAAKLLADKEQHWPREAMSFLGCASEILQG